jgi:hypothetical protein
MIPVGGHGWSASLEIRWWQLVIGEVTREVRVQVEVGMVWIDTGIDNRDPRPRPVRNLPGLGEVLALFVPLKFPQARFDGITVPVRWLEAIRCVRLVVRTGGAFRASGIECRGWIDTTYL